MLKKIIIIIASIIALSGCSNKVEEEKNLYLDTKSTLETTSEFIETSDLPCDITVSLKRNDEEKITYKTIINNPKENMNNIKVLVIHNQYVEKVFPSIGLMDNEAKSLLITEENQEINLTGNLDTTIDITELDLEFRIWLEYEDNNQEIHDIYYKTTI